MNTARLAAATIAALIIATPTPTAQAGCRYVQRATVGEIPLVHVHLTANTNPGGGSWAWSPGGTNPAIRAAMPSPAAVTLLDLRVGDSVSFDGTVPDTWDVVDRMVWGKQWPVCEATVEVTKLNGAPVSLCLDGPRPT